ncbi:hypothetical protein DB30_03459 [Enhygromyxa salina]|uniref:DUF2914 domain-containing protein n=1 Tax=Enhygromyxa salina TaxID=215803 RepID=A0A0C2D216_9BACT|nr:hypothetical protein DB30_03459 [Enhygromyxa salina]
MLTSILSLTPLACDSSGADAPVPATQASEARTSTPANTIAAPTPTPAPVAAPVATPVAPIEDQPVLASAVAPTAEAMVQSPAKPSAKSHAPGSLRSPSLLPAGTPDTHIEAFTNLRLGGKDKAPIGGVGASGIHLDELEVGKGWASSRCEQVGSEFVVDTDERVNVCFRVVHPREAEAVTLEWSRAGKVRQVIEVSVKPTHAYTTRAWMPVSAGRTGNWTATVKSEDGSVLGQISFEIAGPTL